MSNKSLEVLIHATDNATKVIKWVAWNLQDFAKKNEATFRNMATAGTVAFWVLAVGINKTIDNANDLGESINAVKVVFKDGADELLKFGETADKTVWLSKRAFNQLATPIGAMLQNMGQDAKTASKNTVELAKRASDMASVFNTDVSDALGAISAGLRGETDPLERYGVKLNETAIKAYAMANGIGKANGQLTEQEKTTARIGLLMEQTSKLQWDFANTSDQLANSKRILNAQIENVSSTLGQAFLPIINSVMKEIAPLVEKVADWVKQNPELARNIIIATTAVAWLLAVVGAFGLAIPGIITGVSALGTALSFLAFNPIWAVITAIWLLITAGVLLYKNWEEVKLFANSMWLTVEYLFDQKVKSVKAKMEWLRDGVVGIWQGIKDSVTSIVDWMSNKINNILSSIKNAGSTIANMVWLGGNGGIDGARANGGPVRGWWSYIVGEQGPELFVPRSSGSIVPNGAISPSVSLSFGNVNLNNWQDASAFASMVSDVVVREVKNLLAGTI